MNIDPEYYLDLVNLFLNNLKLEEYYEKHGEISELAYLAFFKRPLTPAIAAAFNILFQMPPEIGLSTINAIFFLGSTIIFYDFVKRLGYSANIAFTSAFLYSNSFTLLVIGSGCMTDVGGYFFSIVILDYFISRLNKKEDLKEINQFLSKKLKINDYVILGLLTGVGILARETVLFTTLTLFLYVLLEDLSFKKNKWLINELRTAGFVVISLGIAIIFPFLWIVFGMNRAITDLRIGEISLTIFLDQSLLEHIVFIIFLAFNILYFFIFYGFLKENDRQRIKLFLLYSLIVLIPMFLQFYAIPFQLKPSYRVIFMFFPFFLPFAALGIHEFCVILEKKNNTNKLNRYFWYSVIIGFYVVFNFAFGILYLSQWILNALEQLIGSYFPF